MSHDVHKDQLALIRIVGMHSAKCERAIQKSLLAHPGVHEVEVDFASGQASVLYDQGSVTPEALMESVNQAGYHATGVTQLQAGTDSHGGMRI